MHAHPLDLIVNILSLESFFPRVSIFHLEFGNLVVVDKIVFTLATATNFLFTPLVFSSSFFLVGIIIFPLLAPQ
jgi:hypothetical protein